MTETKLPKIALGAWAWGNDGTFGSGSSGRADRRRGRRAREVCRYVENQRDPLLGKGHELGKEAFLPGVV